jgi:hypothetical protein
MREELELRGWEIEKEAVRILDVGIEDCLWIVSKFGGPEETGLCEAGRGGRREEQELGVFI